MYACLAVTCHLHFWQNDRDFLCATVVTRGWNGYRNKSQHRKSTLEKKILPPFQQGFEPATFQSRVRCSNHWAIPAPPWTSPVYCLLPWTSPVHCVSPWTSPVHCVLPWTSPVHCVSYLEPVQYTVSYLELVQSTVSYLESVHLAVSYLSTQPENVNIAPGFWVWCFTNCLIALPPLHTHTYTQAVKPTLTSMAPYTSRTDQMFYCLICWLYAHSA